MLHDVTESGKSAGKRVNISSQDPHSALSSTSQSTRAVSAWQPISAFLSSAVLRTPLLWTDCHLLQPTLPMWPWKPGSTPFMSSRKLPWSPQKGLDTSALCFPHYIIASPSQKGFLGVGLQQGVLTSHSSPETADGMMKTCSTKGEPTASTAHPQVSAQSSCSTNYLAGQQNTSDAYILSPTPRGLLYPELGAPICTSSWSLTTVENLGKSSLS